MTRARATETESLARGNISSEAVFETLRQLSRADRPLGLADLHDLTGEPSSSVHRAIATLEETGFAARYQGRAQFVPGRMCSHLVRAVVARWAVTRVARPYVVRLVELTGGAGTLNARLGWYAVRLLSLDGRIEYAEARRVGEVRFLHQDLAPLTILGALRPGDLARYTAFVERRLGARPQNPTVAQRLKQAGRDGYFQQAHPGHPGRAWIGMPIRNPATGHVMAAVAVSAALAANGEPEPALLREYAACIAQLHAELAERAEACVSPYATIDPDSILFDPELVGG
jgi:DNA-binding IclR family transcriptional regulator